MADEYGVTSTGFKIKTRDRIVADMESAARGFFGEHVNLSAKSPLGLFIQLLSWPIALVWQALEGVYNSAYVDTATGQSLDGVGKYIGIGRQAATKAVHIVQFSGTQNTIIPAGFIVDTGGKTPVEFEVVAEGVIGSGGTVNLVVQCTQAGSVGNVPIETITEIKNPLSGLNQVITHLSLTSEGLDRETDQEFRARYKKSVAKGGASTLDAIMAAVLEVPNVTDVAVFENDTTTPDSEGRPPKSIEVLVLGGMDDDIARTIFATKAAGIQPYGRDTSVTVIDKAGREHEVWFSRADEIPIYVSVVVTSNASYPSDGDERLQAQVIAYIGGVYHNIFNRGLPMGESVIYMQIPMAIDIPGIEDLDIKIGTSPNPTGTANISMAYNQKAITDADKVVVTSG